MINTKIIAVAKERGGTTIINNSGGSSGSSHTATIEQHYLWGQPFNGTQDVNGSMEINGNITVNNVIASGTVSAPEIDTSLLFADSAQIDSLTATNGYIQTLDSSTITTHNLTVTGSAHFFELIIDKLKSVGGTVILSAANAKVDKVVSVSGGFKLYWRKEDADRAKAISNDFQANDQIICMSFNAQTGVSHNVSNRYYWRLVTSVGDEETTIDGETVSANYIVVSDSVKDGDSTPEPGDEIMQLGYRGNDDAERQSAIIMSAYKSPDTGIQSPAIVQYTGINNFNLSTHRYTWFAHNGNNIRGNLKVENGTSVEDLITEFAVDEDAIIAHINSSLGYTGIDIENQKITLTAQNTNIVGNLNLYDSANNGLTVYDDSSTARVNIQSDALDAIADIASNDSYNYYTLSKSGTVSAWDLTTDTETINWSAGTTVDFDNFNIDFSVGSDYPSVYTMDVQLTVTPPTGQAKTYSFIAYKQDNFGRYRNIDERIRYTAVHAGQHTLTVRCNISNSSVSGTGYLNVNFRLQSATEVQTFIGRDGFYSHAGGNKLIWSSESELQLRYGFSGIRWADADKFRNESMQVCAQIKVSPNFRPVWLPFYNYTPIFLVGVGTAPYLFSSQFIANINGTRYAYQIDALRDCGICYVADSARDGGGSVQESWVILPPETFTDEDGDTVSLPVGYCLTVVNDTPGNVFVCPFSSSEHAVKIVDSNRNENYYCELNGRQSNDTYIYLGSYADGRNWRALHDTQ